MSIQTTFFFFQAEDGIRDGRVTGVQTCALPISTIRRRWRRWPRRSSAEASDASVSGSSSTRSRIGSGMTVPTGRGGEGHHRVPTISPRVEAAGEWTHVLDAATLEEERHPGAGRFTGSGAIEHDLALARDLVMARLQLFGRHVERARDDRRFRLEIDRVAQVH